MTGCRYLLLKAFAAAHEKIINGFSKEDIWDAGTTTLIGGLLVPIEVPGGRPVCDYFPLGEDLHSRVLRQEEKYAFVCASIGDCKAFLYSPKEKKATDITLGNRAGLDATDPGGRLGPFVGRTGDPDLRNLHLYFSLCCEGDIIIVMSDGVHDNLDAYSLGKTPEAVGFPAGTDWKDVTPQQLGIAKSNFMCKKLVEVIGGVVQPDAGHIAARLIEYSLVRSHVRSPLSSRSPSLGYHRGQPCLHARKSAPEAPGGLRQVPRQDGPRVSRLLDGEMNRP